VQGAAEAGEILVTEAMRERLGELTATSAGQSHALKGFDSPVTLYRA
jgi:class 3 adenylate cyclase